MQGWIDWFTEQRAATLNLVSSFQDDFELNQAELSWQEALDTAVEQIQSIADIESARGKAQLATIISKLQKEESYRFDLRHLDGNNSASEDEESDPEQQTSPKTNARFLSVMLPWEGTQITPSQQQAVKTFVLGLSQNEFTLLTPSSEVPAGVFRFIMD